MRLRSYTPLFDQQAPQCTGRGGVNGNPVISLETCTPAAVKLVSQGGHVRFAQSEMMICIAS